MDELEDKIDEVVKMKRQDFGVRPEFAKEESVKEKVDEKGNKWRKTYFGGGKHFSNWLKQCLELYGEDNVETEEIDSKGFQCFEESGEKMYRIWVKSDPKSMLKNMGEGDK